MNIFYTKTALYAYPNLQAIMEQIDDIVERKALTSMSNFSPCEEQCEKILDLTNQKDTLIELKIFIDKALTKLTDEQIDCLEYKYFKRKPKEYFIGFDSCSRAYFRRQVNLVKKISEAFEKIGLTDIWFENYCLTMDFFIELLRRVKKYDEQNLKNKPKKVISKPEKTISFTCEKADIA